MKRLAQSITILLAMSFLMIGFSSRASAQAVEEEPNAPCVEAQDLGPIDVTGTFSVQGSLDTPPEEPDVDFFRFSTTPWALLVADHEGQTTGAGTLSDPFLGLFDSDCNLLALNDDAVGLNSRLNFEVPSDGVFILAASSCCDEQFTGDGGSSGTYQLTIAPAPPPIGAISGRIVDARTGEPLPGNEPPFAFADLLRCEDGDCFDVVSSQSADGEGRFRFERDFNDQPLPVGTYQVTAFANEFEPAQTDLFEVGEGEEFDVGDIPLQPPLFSVSDIRPCDDLLPQGDICRYSFRVTNNTDARLRGAAWSMVDGSGLGSSLTFTQFEASTRSGSRQAVRERVALGPLGEATLEFRFDVPAFVIGATFCTRVLIGVDPSPLVTTVRESFLFCITGGTTGFEVMSASESQKMFESLSGKSRSSPEKRPVSAR